VHFLVAAARIIYRIISATPIVGKSTWHPFNFNKTRKLVSNSLTNQLDKKWKFGKTHLLTRIYARGSWLPSAFPYMWEGEKRNKE
jgi:hypothetical protein